MEQEKRQYWRGLLTGLFLAVIMLCLILLGSEAYQLVTGTSGFRAGFGLIDKKVRDKVSLIEGVIEGYYLNDTDVTLMKEGIYRGIIDSLGDPYSSYYNEEEFNLLMESSSGVFYGVGMYLSQNPDTMEIEVVRPISGSPALEAGIEAGDKIIKVDGEDISGMQLTDVVARVKGLSGTKVKLTMLREGEQMEFEVERREIESETVSYEMKDKKTGYIMIAEFDDVTYQQFKDALDDLDSQGMKSLILDLRGNPGGNLSTVVEIAELLLPKGMIVYTEDKDGNREEYKCSGANRFTKPLVVLVDGNSASAAEILAGAVKDYEIGTLVGTTTFGKGIVQRILPLDDGSAVKLTVSKYYTPKGQNIHGIGIEPDIEVMFDADAYRKDGTDNQLNRALRILEK
ncbi:S41 family peptidase [bacterium C-53]|nr:S41 family peptidase [Lachnospiraceae bacterium]NBI01659.1 S41 family peptidase [Lachnospiraceae bacterium]RKJ12953.1 S41 family peptidase [bacterium C-53]